MRKDSRRLSGRRSSPRSWRRCGPAAGVVTVLALSVLAASCGEDGVSGSGDTGGLTLSSTCADFNSASADAQASAAVRLSAEVGAQDGGNPLWAAQTQYRCANNPDLTLAAVYKRPTTTTTTTTGLTAATSELTVEAELGGNEGITIRGEAPLEDGAELEYSVSIGCGSPPEESRCYSVPNGYNDNPETITVSDGRYELRVDLSRWPLSEMGPAQLNIEVEQKDPYLLATTSIQVP